MKIKYSFLALLLYLVPALSSYPAIRWLDGSLNSDAIFAIYLSAVSSIFGYSVGNILHRRNMKHEGHWNFTILTLAAYALLILAIISSALNFYRIGSFPLFSGNIERLRLWESFLWNLTVIGSSGVFLISWIKANSSRISLKFGWALISIYILLTLLSGWKGTLVNGIIMAMSPFMKNKRIGATFIATSFAALLILFYTVNSIRSDFSPWDAPLYYIYWGFVNFSDLAFQNFDDCLYSVPVFGCHFNATPDQLTNPTWNVFTALTPLYLDGGLLLVGIFFFVSAYLLAWSSKRFNSLLSDYIFYLMTYLFFLAHNGYIFDSKSYLLIFILFWCLTFVARKRRLVITPSCNYHV